MPRIKTKGEAIAFRLPVHLDDAFAKMAEDNGMTPRDYAAKIIEDFITTGEFRRAAGATTPRTGGLGAAIVGDMT